MIAITTMTLTGTISAQSKQLTHPLEPLTESEIKTAIALLKKEKSLSNRVRFPNLSLREPEKQAVLDFKPNSVIAREVFAVVLEPAQNKRECPVSIQNVAIIRSTVFLIVMPRFLNFLKLSALFMAISSPSMLNTVSDVSNCLAMR